MQYEIYRMGSYIVFLEFKRETNQSNCWWAVFTPHEQ